MALTFLKSLHHWCSQEIWITSVLIDVHLFISWAEIIWLPAQFIASTKGHLVSGLVATSPATADYILVQSFQCCECFDSHLSCGFINKPSMCRLLSPQLVSHIQSGSLASLPRSTPSLSPTPPTPEMRSKPDFAHLFHTLLWMWYFKS